MASRKCASVLLLACVAVAAGCGRAPETSPSWRAHVKEGGAPARVIVVRTDRFSLRASAYVELYAELVRRDPEKREAALMVVDGLLACNSDGCARARLAETPYAQAFDEAFPVFLRERWRDEAFAARVAMDRALPWLFQHEGALAARLARELAIAWPDEPIVLGVTTRAAPRHARAVIDAPTLDVEEGCFEGPAVLECAFTRALVGLRSTHPRSVLAHAARGAVAAEMPGYAPR